MEPVLRSKARRVSIQTLKERDLEWKKLMDQSHSYELDEDCIRAHVLNMLGLLSEVDLPQVLHARIVWEELQEGATGQVHPNVAEARKRVEILKKEVESSADESI